MTPGEGPRSLQRRYPFYVDRGRGSRGALGDSHLRIVETMSCHRGKRTHRNALLGRASYAG